MNELKNKRVAVFGLGVSGVSALKLLSALECECFPVNRGNPQNWAQHEGVLAFTSIENCYDQEDERLLDVINLVDIMVLSPGIPRDHALVKKVLEANKEVIGEIELAHRVLSSLNLLSPVIGITGTNGKTTTTTFLGEAIANSQNTVFVGGNIGTPYSDYALEVLRDSSKKVDYVVLELSSFQLESVFKFKVDIGLILNLYPSHGERYSKIEDYGNSKLLITNNFDEKSFLIITDQSDYILKNTKQKNYKRKIISNDEPEFNNYDVSTFKLPGIHNRVNLACALEALDKLGIKKPGIQKTIDVFKGVSHRIESVKSNYKNLRIFNDAKSTNWDATLTALKACAEYNEPIFLILGGQKRGHGDSISPYFLDIMSEVHFIYLIGEMGDEIEKEFDVLRYSTQGYYNAKTLEGVREHLFTKHKGEKILLLFSPAFPSFDQFNNYAHRGDCFKQIFS